MAQMKTEKDCRDCESLADPHKKSRLGANAATVDTSQEKKTLCNVLMNDAAIYRGDLSKDLPQVKERLNEKLANISRAVTAGLEDQTFAAELLHIDRSKLLRIKGYCDAALKDGPLIIDNRADAKFEAAVKAFQAYEGLPETGIFGFRTARRLECERMKP